MKLNYGCGETKFKNCVNIDIEESTKPDLVCDLRKGPLPYESESVEEVRCFHNIEHIEYKFWHLVFSEFHRVLVPNGLLLISYPEFSRAARYFMENKHNKKAFWRNVLYGRQLYPGDYHVTPVESEDIANQLREAGFKDIRYAPEDDEDGNQNTFLTANRGTRYKNQEDLILEEVFGDTFRN